MATPAELFFAQLTSFEDLERLIGQPEDALFDCKVWSSRKDANRGSIAKAACGFTNANGGVLIIGVEATGRGADTPDVVQALQPFSAPNEVASQVLDIILNFVEPGIEGVLSKVLLSGDAKAGFVIVQVPASDGAVRRSRQDWKFYVRITSGTVPMEYFQIEERFGRRPSPNLDIELRASGAMESSLYTARMGRHVDIWLRNQGRGLVRFPGIRIVRTGELSPAYSGIDGNGGTGLPLSASEGGSILLRGGADNVIYPGECYLAAKLWQGATVSEVAIPQAVFLGYWLMRRTWTCSGGPLSCEVYAENMQPKNLGPELAEDSVSEDYKKYP